MSVDAGRGGAKGGTEKVRSFVTFPYGWTPLIADQQKQPLRKLTMGGRELCVCSTTIILIGIPTKILAFDGIYQVAERDPWDSNYKEGRGTYHIQGGDKVLSLVISNLIFS